MKQRYVLLLVPNDGLLFEPSGIADIFNQANQYIPAGAARYTTVVATTGSSRIIRGRSGLSLLADVCVAELDLARPWDTVIVTNRAIDPVETGLAVKTVSLLSGHCRRIVSVCVDALSTLVIGKRMVKVLSWYDNEWGFSSRLVDLAALMDRKGA